MVNDGPLSRRSVLGRMAMDAATVRGGPTPEEAATEWMAAEAARIDEWTRAS